MELINAVPIPIADDANKHRVQAKYFERVHCYDDQGGVAQRIAEVTNTPCDPGLDLVPKPFTVSPFTNMKAGI